jgi:Peptidase family C25/Propeptide_C25/FlgD Ig-like domain/Peptidase family C25, C terminal ig-like domain
MSNSNQRRLFVTNCLMLSLSLLVLGIPQALALAEAETHSYGDSWGPEGLTMSRQAGDKLELNFSLSGWTLGSRDVNGRAANFLTIAGAILPNDSGAPDLPGISHYIALPNGATASVRLIDSRRETYYGVEMAPAPVIPLDTDNGPLEFTRNNEIFAKDSYYPESPLMVGNLAPIRGVNAAMLGITPFQYNPVRQELVVFRDIRLEIVFDGGNGQFGQDRLRSKWFDPILNDIFLNASSLPAVPAPESRGKSTPDFEYVIISPPLPTSLAWADSLRRFRTEQGIRTGVFTTVDIGGNTTAAIEGFINDAYNTWDVPPVAVLLLGDHGTEATDVIAPIYDSYCVSDNIYADVSGNHMPDLILARMTAENPTNLETFVRKVLDYEMNPPTSPDFYAQPVISGGWQTERWFVLCDEVIYGFMANELGKVPTREYAIYDGSPTTWSTATNTQAVLDYFGPGGLGYLPASPSHLTDWGANATRLNADINAGTFMVQHRDHGGETGWGEPDYTINDLTGLNNDDLTFVFSINCLTGKYNYGSECFAESFHRHNQGALGLIAASEVSYSFVNDAYVWGMFDYMWPDFDPGYGVAGVHKFLPAFANASGKYFLQASSWPYNTSNKEVTYYLFHHHGDAFSTVFSEVPANLVVAQEASLISGVDFFKVSVDEGALIGLSVGGELIGSVVSVGGENIIPIPSQMPGQDLIVTVTKQNHYRQRIVVPIIPPEGSFVIFDDVIVNDEFGDGDGQLDFTEEVTLAINLHNVGLDIATGVSAVISTDDPMITILNDSETYGDMAAGGFLMGASEFRVVLDASVPDGHVIDFVLVATDADSSYTSGFSLTAQAPELAIDGVTVSGDADADGILDPGESATLTVTLINQGTSTVEGIVAGLTSLNPNVVLVSSQTQVPVLAPGGRRNVVWQVTAAEETPVGEVGQFDLDILAENYHFSGDFVLNIGLSIEDFETNNFLAYPWEMGGTSDWFLTEIDPQEGLYAAQSGALSDGQVSEMFVELAVLAPGTITFMAKVSSESTYDYLRFAIDDVELGSWSGTVGWTEVSYAVDPGNHIFKWRYTKDGSVSNGSDCGWVDNIIFPAIGEPLRPTCAITPGSLAVQLSKPNSSTRMLTMTNTGEGELEYQATCTLGARKQSEVPFETFKKDEPDTRTQDSEVRATGGPDAFGYSWIDSDQTGGPVYDWVEINGLGTLAGSGDDASLGPFAMSFPFPYYGGTFEEVRVCTNGWLSFTSTSTAYSNQGIPGTGEPNNLLAVFWDDFNPNDGGSIYYYDDLANNRFIVEYDGVYHYSTGNPETFQVILNADGSILYQYKEVVANTSCSVGTEDATGTAGLQITFNAAYLHSEMAILIVSEPLPEPWMSLDSQGGTVGPFSSGDLELTFNTVDAEIGEYQGMVTVHTNDLENPVTDIPITLTVTSDVSGVDDGGVPTAFALGGAYPNPFNPATTIKYATPRTGLVSLKIYNLAGHLVRTLVDGQKTAGYHSIMWDGADHKGRTVASGTYYYRLQADGFEQSQKMLLLK